jgi:copper chaperone CopZ
VGHPRFLKGLCHEAIQMLGIVILCWGISLSQATASDPTSITISVSDIHCAGCGKKLSAELTKIAGVSKAEVDVENKTVTLTAKSKQAPSPKALWEAVEKAGKTPTKLISSQGTFTEKPSR